MAQKNGLVHQIPRYLHLPKKLLWFDAEDWGLMGAVYFLWLIVDNKLVLVVGAVLCMAFINTKQKMPRGFLGHLIFRMGFWKSKRYPSTAVRVHHE